MAVSANRLELLQIADAVAREKSIDRQIVLSSMEDAIQKAARSRYGQETEVRAEINPKTGEIRFSRLLLVVEEVENDSVHITLPEARRKNPAAQIGDWISETLPPFDFGRIAAQSAKQVIVQKVREAERDRQFEDYKDRIGEIVNGIVKRVEYGNVVIDLGRGEAIVRRDEMIPREMFKPGDRIRAYVYDVRREQRGPQIFLSRTHPQFMAKLFMQEVPEIYDGIIEVKAVARDPGSRAKIAVISRDSSIDPVGACVGMRGSRVQAVVNELQGEKVDIIPWSADAATFIVNGLQPAEVVKVVLDEDASRIEVVVPDDQLSLAIGRRGQNVRLASQLTGWDIDIMTEEEESERRQKEFAERTALFMAALDVDEVVGQLLASEGFRSVEELAYVDASELQSIEGFDEETATEIQNRARGSLAQVEQALEDRRLELGVTDELREVQGLTTAMMVKLGENEVRTIEDLAGCATDDLVGWDRAGGSGCRSPRRILRRARSVARGCRSADHVGPYPRGLGRCAARGGGRGTRGCGASGLTHPMIEAFNEDISTLDESGPERTCIVTRAKGSKDSLIRFVVAPDLAVVPDIRAKLPGRGAWVTATAATVGEAVRKKAFARAFKKAVAVPTDLADQIALLLERDALQALSMVSKAGLVVCGSTKVEAAIAAKPIAGLVHAKEAGHDGVRKLDAALKRRFGDVAHSVCRIHLFASAQLDLALGRVNVIHAALVAGAASEGFIKRTDRLDRYRGLGPL